MPREICKKKIILETATANLIDHITFSEITSIYTSF